MSKQRVTFAPKKGVWHQISAWLFSRQAIEIFEGVLGVFAIGLLDYLLPTELGLQQFDLYLLWVVVLGISARYGAPAGYIVSILAAATFDAMLLLHANPYVAISPHLAIQPFLLFASGILVSELVRIHKRDAAQAKEKLEEVKAGLRQLQEQYTLTLEAKNELERRIANQPISIGTVSEFGHRMSVLRTEELFPTIFELLHSMLDVQACALYVAENRQLRLMAGQPEGYADRPVTITTDNALAQRAMRERRVVTIRDMVQHYGPATPPRAQGAIAGPLVSREGQLLGVIVIERLPFFKLTPGNIRLFEQLLKWIAGSLQNAIFTESLMAQAQ